MLRSWNRAAMHSLNTLVDHQDGVLTRRQALEMLSPKALEYRLGRQWRVVLPGVYATHTGSLTAHQRLRAGLLYAGDEAQLDDVTALRFYAARYLPADDRVFVLVPWERQRQSREFVVVRRTRYLPVPVMGLNRFPIAPTSRALADLAVRLDDERTVRAVVLSAVQRRIVTAGALHAEAATAPSRGLKRYLRVLDEVDAGVRSVGESDVRQLFASSRILPRPLYNCLLELPSGKRVSPDALIEDAALVHEVNGREAHADEDPFDSMQARHDEMAVCGLTVLHNSPRLISQKGRRLLTEMEQCYSRDRGRGLPSGVRIIRRGPEGA
jgi:hypothetical protein